MKKYLFFAVILVCGFAISFRAQALRSLGESLFLWKPKVFQADDQVSSAALSAMVAENDSVTGAILADSPGFKDEFAKRITHFLTLALNSVLIPGNGVLLEKLDRENVGTSEYKTFFGYMVGKMIKNIRMFVSANALEGLSHPQAPQNFKYKYCEQHSEQTDWPCTETGNEQHFNDVRGDSREYIFLRRFVSRPEFVAGACPLVSRFGAWYLNWGYVPGVVTPAQKMEYYKRVFAQIDSAIADINGDGTWKVRFPEFPNHIDHEGPNSPLDPQFVEFMQRRYLDGGPKYLASLSACLSSFREDFVNQSLTTSPEADAQIAQLIAFRETGAHVRTLIADANLNDLTRYRIAHTMSANELLPENLFYSPTGETLDPWSLGYNSIDVFGRIHWFDNQSNSNTYGPPDQEVQFLNNVDSRHRYAFMRVADYERLKQDNSILFKPSDIFCMLGNDPASSDQFVSVNGQVLPVAPSAGSTVCIDRENRTNRFFILRTNL